MKNLEEQIDEILEEFGYAVVNHPEATRQSHIRTYRTALTNLISIQEGKAREVGGLYAQSNIRSSMLYYFAYSGRKTIRYSDLDNLVPETIDPMSGEPYQNLITKTLNNKLSRSGEEDNE